MCPGRQLFAILLVARVFVKTSHYDVATTAYTLSPCSHNATADILTSGSFQEAPGRSLFDCASRCSESQLNGQTCRHAIYQDSTSSCKLIQTSDAVKSVPDFIYQIGCTVLSSTYRSSCQNGGQKINATCACPDEFTGRYCELPNPVICQTRAWKLAKKEDYANLTTNQIPIKMILFGSEIVSVSSFDRFGSNTTDAVFVAQANGHVDWVHGNSGHLSNPYEVAFLVHDASNGALVQAKVSRLGDVSYTPMDVDVELYIPTVVGDESLVNGAHGGPVSDVVTALTNGHQLLVRDFSRVAVYEDPTKTFSETFETRLGLDPNHSALDTANWPSPLTYVSFRQFLTTGLRQVVNHKVKDGVFTESRHGFVTTTWELDRCWMKLHDSGDDGDLASALKEYVERGFEIRVGVEGSLHEVTDIRSLNSEVIAQFVPFIDYPSGSGSTFDSKINKMVTYAISLSKRMATCHRDLEGLDPARQSVRQTAEPVDWFIGSRPWKKLLSMDSKTSAVLSGNKNDVMEAGKLGKNFRICLQYQIEDYRCMKVRGVRIAPNGNFLLVQTWPILKLQTVSVDFDDIKCVRIVYVVSTDGWLRRLLMNGAAENDIRDETTLRMDWFVEQ